MAALTYISNARLPSEKANAFQSMQQCEALGRFVDLEFLYPRRSRNPLGAHDIFGYFGTAATFRLRSMPCLDWPALRAASSRAGFLTQAVSFQSAAVTHLARAGRVDAVYSRHALDVFLLPALRAVQPRAGLFLEDHDGLFRRLPGVKRQLLRLVDGIVVTTDEHAAELTAWGVSPRHVLVAPNAVDVERFSGVVRGSSTDAIRVVYVGNLFAWKGVDALVDAIGLLPPHYSLTVIGGSPELAGSFEGYVADRGLSARVRRIGPVPPGEVPGLLTGASVVVLPNSGRTAVSARLTSPLKLFEYMASNIPIVASDLPATRAHLVHDGNAWLVPPDDPAALAAGIRHLVEHPDLGLRLATAARRDVEAHTWTARARRILDFMARRGARVQEKVS